MRAPLLCIAGTLCDERVFAPMLSACGAADATCASVEQASVGDAANALLTSAPDQFIAVGFSLGGFVAIELARRAPDRLLGVALISSNARADSPENASPRQAQLEMFQLKGAAAVVADMWPNCVSLANAGHADIRASILAMAESTPYERLAAQTRLAMTRPHAGAALATLIKPVLAVHGRDDMMCPPDRAVEVAKTAALGSLELVDGAGHFAPLEEPDLVADALMTWLAREGFR